MMDPDDIDQLFIEIQKRYPTARWAEGTIIIRPEGTETIDAYRARNFMRAIVKRGVKALAWEAPLPVKSPGGFVVSGARGMKEVEDP